MDPEVLNFANVAEIIVAMSAGLSVIGIGCAYAVIKLKQLAAAPPPLDDPRLRQIQDSIDAVAIEVERIAEAQRFSAKLLAEKVEA